jgi:hypothetical protein
MRRGGFTHAPTVREAPVVKRGRLRAWRCDEETHATLDRIGAGCGALLERASDAEASADLYRSLAAWAIGGGDGPVDEAAEEALFRAFVRGEVPQDEPEDVVVDAVKACASRWQRAIFACARRQTRWRWNASALSWREAAERVHHAARCRAAAARLREALRAALTGDEAKAGAMAFDAAEQLGEPQARALDALAP